MNCVFVFATGIGIVAGLRSLLAPAVVAWAAHFGWLNLHGSPLAFMGSTIAVAVFSLFAIGELVGDKLPKTPKRTALAPLSAHPHGRPLRRESLRSSREIVTYWHAPGRNRRRDRSVRRLRDPEASREQSAHQRSLYGHLRRFGCDCSSLFPCRALTQTRPIPIFLFLHGRSPVASLGI